MLTIFLSGGLAGALGFKHVGYSATILLAGILVVLAAVPMVDDLREWARGAGSSAG
jgi:predicted MFS family arabinose efflux permease